MNLLHLQEFLVLVETLSYSIAADRLYMNASTMSKHIKNLESELGVELFERTSRQVILTDEGKRLLPYARQISTLIYQYRAEHIRKSDKLLTIGTIPTMMQYNIVDLILAFKEQYPEIRIKIVEDDTLTLRQGLLNEKYELAFLRDGNTAFINYIETDKLLVKHPYQTDNLVAVIPEGHPLSGSTGITLPQLKNHRLCLLKEGTFLYDLCVQACHAADFVPNIFFESHRIANIIEMCIKGGCVALLLDHHLHSPAPETNMALGKLSVIPVLPRITTTISLCHLNTGELSSAAEKFIRFFEEQNMGGKPDALGRKA